MKALITSTLPILLVLIGQISMAQSNTTLNRHKDATNPHYSEASSNDNNSSSEARHRVESRINKMNSKKVQFLTKTEGDAIRARRVSRVKSFRLGDGKNGNLNSKAKK